MLFDDFAGLLETGEGALEEGAKASFLSFLTGERGFFVLESFVGEEGDMDWVEGSGGIGCRFWWCYGMGALSANGIDGIIDALVDEAGETVATPGDANELFEEFEFGGSLRLEFVDESGGEILEDLLVLGFDDEGVAVEAKTEGIEAGFEFAFGGFWAGSLLGVAAVCGDLFVGSHD